MTVVIEVREYYRFRGPITSARLEREKGGHDRISLWEDHACAGTLNFTRGRGILFWVTLLELDFPLARLRIERMKNGEIQSVQFNTIGLADGGGVAEEGCFDYYVGDLDGNCCLLSEVFVTARALKAASKL